MSKFKKGDRVELLQDYGRTQGGKTLPKGRQGTIGTFSNDGKAAYVKFDRYTGGTRCVPLSYIKKI